MSDSEACSSVDWCLDSLLHRFFSASNAKIDAVIALASDRDIDVNKYLKSGTDCEFDSCIRSLSVLAKHSCEKTISCLLSWQNGDPNTPSTPIKDEIDLPNEISDSESIDPISPESDITRCSVAPDSRVVAVNIIFCRAIVEIISNLPLSFNCTALDTCEAIAFNQIIVAAKTTRFSVHSRSNLHYFSEVLGALSLLRFSSVTDRFISFIEKNRVSTKDFRLDRILFAVRFIKLKLFPIDMLEESADFLGTLGGFFLSAPDMTLRIAYMDAFLHLLSPICPLITIEQNIPSLKSFVESIYPKIIKRVARPRYQSCAFPLAASLLCISTDQFFAANWNTLLEFCQSKLKERSLREQVLLRFSQMLWVYLFRIQDTPANAQKRITAFLKFLFPFTRHLAPSEHAYVVFVHIIFTIGVRFPNWTVLNILSVLLHCDGPIETWVPDRLTLAIDALYMLHDAWARGEQTAPFPVPGMRLKPKDDALKFIEKANELISLLNPQLFKIFESLQTHVGIFLLDEEKNKSVCTIRGTFSNDSSASTFKRAYFAVLGASVPKDRASFLELTKTLITFSPKLMIHYEQSKLLEILCNYLSHYDKNISTASYAALVSFGDSNLFLYPQILANLEKKVASVTARQYDMLGSFAVRNENEIEGAHIGLLEAFCEFFIRGNQVTRSLSLDYLVVHLMCTPYVHVHRILFRILASLDTKINTILEHLNFSEQLVISSTAYFDDFWNKNFDDFASYCVDFLSRDSIKKLCLLVFDRVKYLDNHLYIAESGLLWSSSPRAPSDQLVVNWRRCSSFLFLGCRYLSAPRDVFASFISQLGNDISLVRESVYLLCCQTPLIFHPVLLEESLVYSALVVEDLRQRSVKWFISSKKPSKQDRLRVELPKLLTVFTFFPPNAVSSITALLKSYKLMFLDQKANQENESLRTSLCLFINHYYSSACDHKHPELRSSLFLLLSEWEENFAANAMAAIVRTQLPLPDSIDSEHVFKWINTLISRSAFDIATKALSNMLLFNSQSSQIYETVLNTCFTCSNPNITKCYFSAIADAFIHRIDDDWCCISSLLLLGLIMLSDSDDFIRKTALNLLDAIEEFMFLELGLSFDHQQLSVLVLYKFFSHSVLERLMKNHPDWAIPLIVEIYFRMSNPNIKHMQSLWSFLPILLCNIHYDCHENDYFYVLEGLVHFTATASCMNHEYTRESWRVLCVNFENKKAIVNFVYSKGLEFKSAESIKILRSILLLLGDPEVVFQLIADHVVPSSFIPEPESINTENTPLSISTKNIFIPNLAQILLPSPKYIKWTRGVVGSLLLSALVYNLSSKFLDGVIPFLVQLFTCQVDYPDEYIATEMRKSLNDLLENQVTVESQDISCILNEMVTVLPPGIVESWNSLAFYWASSCTIQQVALKSLQMFRVTLKNIKENHLADTIQLLEAEKINYLFTQECLIVIKALLSHRESVFKFSLLEKCFTLIFSRLPNPHADNLMLILEIVECILSRISCLEFSKLDALNSLCICRILLVTLQTSGNPKCCDLLLGIMELKSKEPEPTKLQDSVGFLVFCAFLPMFFDKNNAFSIEFKNGVLKSKWDHKIHLKMMVQQMPASAATFKKYMANFESVLFKSVDDFASHVAANFRVAISAELDACIDVFSQFLSCPREEYVKSFLILLKHVFSKLVLDQEQLQSPHRWITPTKLLDLTTNTKHSELAHATLDALLRHLPRLMFSQRFVPKDDDISSFGASKIINIDPQITFGTPATENIDVQSTTSSISDESADSDGSKQDGTQSIGSNESINHNSTTNDGGFEYMIESLSQTSLESIHDLLVVPESEDEKE